MSPTSPARPRTRRSGTPRRPIRPTAAQLADIVAFESGIYTAQEIDRGPVRCTARARLGGPVALSLQKFFIGVNDPLGNNPTGAPFTSNIFDLYRPWLSAHGTTTTTRAPPVDRAWRGGVQHDADQHYRRRGPQRRAQGREHPGILRHLPRHAQCRQPFGQGAARHRHRRCGRQGAAGPQHLRAARVHADLQEGPLAGQIFRSPIRDVLLSRAVRRHRQGEGADPARARVARARISTTGRPPHCWTR